MYLPAQFEERRPEVLHALLRAHPLATWVSQRDGELVVEHVPFLLDPARGEHGTLIGHVARANPVWRQLAASVLVFQGPQAYVSPAWYPSKQVHGKVVPTWNYAVVHAHGQPRAIEDPAALRQIVSRLTDTHEAGRAQPWQVADAPADYIDQMLAAIVGIEMPIERLVGKWKVSQNRSAADRAGVAAGLLADAAPQAAAMAALVQPSTDA
ncbi:FMN-binding negative transcriptional regulator [Leptothrix cholodnii SP-6]|uniref:FMN-binding negative transcriptional regulator n=1 Tax=Leptothrix cholodnii (strain ATCC 51168 / LMG 8142 / SP-6) TaxID=395495 RepID=B1Y573_LEPCP|nr:FMN-binding negative transcriptional regulator [Leptothrix cholodnii]ACB32303.1 FMN-binding negative transcriptional regulator [Leptothrix cholodnii SP-6]